MMVERAFDVHVLDKGHFLGIIPPVPFSVPKHLSQKREPRRWNEEIVDFLVIWRFRKEEVVDRSESQYGVELVFQLCEECLALRTVEEYHVTNSQLE